MSGNRKLESDNNSVGFSGLYKLYRFALIYGLRRAAIKALGRLRIGNFTSLIINPCLYFRKNNRFISVIGCGQFSYSTISFFLIQRLGNCIDACFDIDDVSMETYSRSYGSAKCLDVKDLLTRKNTSLVYIASNHASHTSYAIECIKNNLDVYVEKPLAVSWEELAYLRQLHQQSSSMLYVGYNRPFSRAIRELRSKMSDGPFTLTCTVIGHKLESNHWYRKPSEGTRVCGNLGHWIDLSVHLMWSRKGRTPERVDINISYADKNEFDDNITVCLSSSSGDLIVLTLTAREEPFEGITENIVFQQAGILAKIDDFRRAEFQVGSRKIIRRYFPKDVGHKDAILQPFGKLHRDLNEVYASTELMLHIADMVREVKHQSVFIFKG